MYTITTLTGTILGITESPTYIKLHPNGGFTLATAEDAVGIAYRSVPYNLIGHDDIDGADTVVISEIDAGKMFEQYATFDDLAAAYSEGVQEA